MRNHQPADRMRSERPVLVGEARSRLVRGALLTDGTTRFNVLGVQRRHASEWWVHLQNAELLEIDNWFRVEDILELGYVR